MSAQAVEIYVRQQTKAVIKLLEAENFEDARQIILDNKDILKYNFGLVNFVPLIPRIRFSKRIPNANNALKMIIETGCEIFAKEGNVNELLFFAAAKCDTVNLIYSVKCIIEKDSSGINQVRDGDTVLMFLIKYGNLANEKYPECMKIVIDAGVDVNRSDYFSHNPITFITNEYDKYKQKLKKHEVVIQNLRSCIQLLLDTKAIDVSSLKPEIQEVLKDFRQLEYHGIVNKTEQQKDRLFKLLVQNDENTFIRSKEVKTLLDADDGNNTFLQLCCEKNFKKAAKFLIDQGADVCKTTERNEKTPLELAARRNHLEIFEYLLGSNKITINKELFLIFLRSRPKHIKAKYFDEILKYKNLDLDIKSFNGNTPLHYAIIFSSTEAIKVLLQRGASLTVENDSKKSSLDYISPEDLENHLNRCVIPDSYNDINSGKYELAFNFRNLIKVEESRMTSELEILQKICNSPKLCHLLQHPLISSFIDIKWKLIQSIHRKFFIFNMLFYIVTTLSFINLSLLSYIAIPLALIYAARIWLIFNWSSNKRHEIVDISIAAIILISSLISDNVLRYQLGITATMLMAFSFHLFWRFNPIFSQFHAFLANIITQLFSYMFYIISLLLFFGAAFHIFSLAGHKGGTLNEGHESTPSIYLLSVLGVSIGVMIIMTIINSAAFLHDDFGNSRDNFGVLGKKNTFIFLETVEQFYLKYRMFASPFIFDEINEEGQNEKDGQKKQKRANKNRNRFLVNFYVNANKFSCERLIGIKLTDRNVEKIKKALDM